MTTMSAKLEDILERHAEHFGMDDTTTLQYAIAMLAKIEASPAGTSWDEAAEALHAEAASRLTMATEDAKTLARFRDALEEIDALDPKDFMGPSHLAPAFQKPDIPAAFRKVVQIVNGVLHDADEYGDALPPAPRSLDELARAVVEACVASDQPVVEFTISPAEMSEIQKLEPASGINVSEWESLIGTAVRNHDEHMAVGMRSVQVVVS